MAVGASTALAQQNFTIDPAKPKPGDVITVTYVPSGEIASSLGKVEAVVYLSGSNGRSADDLELKKSGKKYLATIKTDATHNFIQLGFYVDQKFDTHFGEGYYIHLYDNDVPVKGSYSSLGLFHMYYGSITGLEKDNAKAIAAFEKDFDLYPTQKRAYAESYLRTLSSEEPGRAAAYIEKELENTINAGLDAEDDYDYVETLCALGKKQDKLAAISAEKQAKFPQGKWKVAEAINAFYKENDLAAKRDHFNSIVANIKTNPDWSREAQMEVNYRRTMMSAYAKAKDWESYKALGQELPKNALAASYNSLAWSLQEKNEDLALAEELARTAVEISRNEWKNPSDARPSYMTSKNWEANRKYTYGAHADTYAMVLYRLGRYEDGYAIARESALNLREGKDADYNNTYALLAEKVLPKADFKIALEGFVKDGQATTGMKDMLKKIYVGEKKSEEGFDSYITALERDAYLKMLKELRESMLNEEAKAFSLVDLDGKNVSLADLKGKIVVIDFWATWCGPCKASFPGMQKMVDKYKDSPDIKFLFVDTWERGDNKAKNASDFIQANKYTFHVLMDNDDKVVEQFKVEGIPTKFVLDKDGRIRFKSVGFGGSDDKLISELTAMIEMAKGEKAF